MYESGAQGGRAFLSSGYHSSIVKISYQLRCAPCKLNSLQYLIFEVRFMVSEVNFLLMGFEIKLPFV